MNLKDVYIGVKTYLTNFEVRVTIAAIFAFVPIFLITQHLLIEEHARHLLKERDAQLYNTSNALKLILLSQHSHVEHSATLDLIRAFAGTTTDIEEISWRDVEGNNHVFKTAKKQQFYPDWLTSISELSESTLYIPFPKGELKLHTSNVWYFNDLWQYAQFIAKLVTIEATIFFIGFYFLVRRIYRPIREASRSLEQHINNNTVIHISESGPREWLDVARAITRMTRRSTTLLDSLTKNEKLLQERLNFQTALFDTLPVPVFTKNTKGEYTAYNRAWLNFFGFDISGNADIAQPDIPISDTALQLEKEVDSALYRTKKSRNYELTMPFKDGTKKELLVSKASFTDANGNIAGLIGVMIDISDLKHAEAYARHVEFEKASADAASRAKSAFIANISHEVRTPLTAIIGFAETLLDYDQGMSDRIEGIKTIIRAGKHLHQIINEVLDLSKIESGKLEIENSEVGLFGLLEDVTALAKLQARNNGVEFGVNYEYPLPIHFSCDPTRTKQILYNIIGNAIKFTRGGEVNLSVRCDRNDQKILFSIKDTGIGISDEQMSKLFQPFIQADTSTTRKFGGTGLGLYLSRALAQKMGGDITVTSTFGKGSCFTISLATGALSNVFFTHKLITNTDAPHQIPPTNSITLVGSILVVDDQPDNRRLVELYLRKVGLQCVGAENGEDGVTMAQNVPFDIILMDVNMPVMDGLTATKILRQRNYNGVILALTANVAGEDIARCLNAGCNDVISKPIDRQEFLEKIREHLTPTQRTSENPAPMESSLVPDDPISAELIQFFVELLPHRLSDLDHAYDMADWPGIRDKAHALKGVGGGYGYPQITQVASKLEFCAAKGDRLEIKLMIDRLHYLAECIYLGAKQIPNAAGE